MATRKTTRKKASSNLEIFTLAAPDATTVQLVGDFTKWEEAPIAMARQPDGTWKVAIELAPGTHQYRFLVDDQWCDDPGCESRAANPFGSANAVREVATAP